MKNIEGTVIETEGGRALILAVPAESPCKTCKSPCASGSCSKLKPTKLWVKNTAGAVCGERVTVKTSENASLVYGLLCMILPLLSAGAAYFLIPQGLSENLRVAVCVATFLAIFVLTAVAVRLFAKHRPDSEAISVLSNEQ